jgi:5-methylcytosine-specific restriction endonuclease McrA
MRLTFCAACGSTSDLQHHHLVMKSEGGSDHEPNRVTLCTSCHHAMHHRQMHGAYNLGQLVKAAQARASGPRGADKPTTL